MTLQTSVKPIWFRAYSLRNKVRVLGALIFCQIAVFQYLYIRHKSCAAELM
jgi:hypothetical protein